MRCLIFSLIFSFVFSPVAMAINPSQKKQKAETKAEESKINIAPKIDTNATPENNLGQLALDQDFQNQMDKRAKMLGLHPYFGYATFALMTAALLTPESNLNAHKALGIASALAYGGTAYLSLAAPHPPGYEATGKRKIHEHLAILHGIGMILTPIFGAIRYSQKEKGQAYSGVAKLHPATAIATYLSFTAAMTIMTF